jgi:hypothetical protein
MIGVADPERFLVQRAEQADLREVKQGNRQHQQRREHGPAMRILLGVKVRQDGHHREQVADEVAAGVAEKRAGVGKFHGRKPTSAPHIRKPVMATRYSPFAAAMSAKKNAPIAPSPAHRPFMLSMKLKALMTVSSQRIVMA